MLWDIIVMNWKIIVIYLVIYCVYASIWGVVVDKVIENKGYSESWFWWGFFFGFWALIVALTKPNNTDSNYHTYTTYTDSSSVLGKDYVFRGFGSKREARLPDSWQCRNCGKINAGCVGTCGCGCDKSGNMPQRSGKQMQNTEMQNTEMQKLYCTSCGKQIEADTKFCRYCGTKVNL